MTINNSNRPKRDLSPQSEFWWSQPLFLGVIGLGLLLLLAPNAGLRPPADEPGDSMSRQAPEGPKAPVDPQRTPALDQTNSRLALWQQLPDPAPGNVWTTEKQAESPAQPPEPVQRAWQLDTVMAQVKSNGVITVEGAREIKRMLRELRKQGAAAVPTIRDFLRQKEDVNFDKMRGGELMEQHTLRQALFDTLGQIGGNEAMAVSLEQLRETLDPAEIAMLAQNLEKEAPGEYREEILRIATNALRLLVRSKEQVEAGPLFELFRNYGGVKAVANLRQFTANADTLQYLRNRNLSVSPTWRVYSLIALAGLPEGRGIPSLVALAGDPDVPVEHKPELPFQMLAQASMEYDEAGEALVDLARARQIPDRAWSVVGEALAGKYLQFPSQLSGGTLLAGKGADISGIEAPFLRGWYDDERNIKYEQRLVSADWSAGQLKQQLALIDKLLGVTSSPAAVKALQQAQESLRGGSH